MILRHLMYFHGDPQGNLDVPKHDTTNDRMRHNAIMSYQDL
jgi:hypothetical protein